MKFFTIAALAALASAVALPEADHDLERRQINFNGLNGLNGLNGNGLNGWNSEPPLPYAGYAPVCSSSTATALCCQLDAIGLADLTCVPRMFAKVLPHDALLMMPATDTASVEGFKQSCSSLGRTPACCALSIVRLCCSICLTIPWLTTFLHRESWEFFAPRLLRRVQMPTPNCASASQWKHAQREHSPAQAGIKSGAPRASAVMDRRVAGCSPFVSYSFLFNL